MYCLDRYGQYKDLAKIEALHPMFIESLNKAREQKNAEKREEGITKKDVENRINVYDFLTLNNVLFSSFYCIVRRKQFSKTMVDITALVGLRYV